MSCGSAPEKCTKFGVQVLGGSGVPAVCEDPRLAEGCYKGRKVGGREQPGQQQKLQMQEGPWAQNEDHMHGTHVQARTSMCTQ